MATLDRREAVPVWCRLRIPHSYTPAPVLSTLASRYGLDINITTARLGCHGLQDGWFDLALNGQPHQILASLRYLQQLQVEIAQLGPKPLLARFGGLLDPLIPVESPLSSRPEPPTLAIAAPGATVQTREVEVTIPSELRYRPVLFSLVHSHRLAMTIVGALLEPHSPEAGRFELVLSGTPSSIEVGLATLRQQALVV